MNGAPEPEPTAPVDVGIAGVSGYTGVELVRLITGHPRLRLAWIGGGRSAGSTLGASWPALRGLPDLADRLIAPADDVEAISAACDAVFLALPHGHASHLAPRLLDLGVRVVDLGADFRLQDPEVYTRFYDVPHASPHLLPQAVYGLPELRRQALSEARLIANPGCYPTAVSLAASPLIEAGLVDGPLVASCVSGASGAGRTPGPRNAYCETTDAVRPYGLAGTHRHTPEIEQVLDHPTVFSPHVVPMARGMVATVHARLSRPLAPQAVADLYVARYGGEPFLTLVDTPPTTAEVRGTNRALLHVVADVARQTAVVVCVIDNLVKGASGQAVQCLNLALGLPETLGLPLHPLLP